MQPGDSINLFDGVGGEWSARIVRMGRSEVAVEMVSSLQALPELSCAVTLAIGIPANERMDWLVEKATELGVAELQPLICERSVLRVHGDRALKKAAHWQAIAVAACEQSGRATVPVVAPITNLADWLGGLGTRQRDGGRQADTPWFGVLSLREAGSIGACLPGRPLPPSATFLSGPEGGLSAAEEDAAIAAGLVAVSLGARILRADTAPLTALAWVSLTDAAIRR